MHLLKFFVPDISETGTSLEQLEPIQTKATLDIPSFSSIKQISISIFKQIFEEGMLHFYDAYGQSEKYFGRVYRNLTDWVWSMLFNSEKGNFQETALQTVQALKDLKLSDPIPEEISKAVVQTCTPISLIDDVYFAAIIASGEYNLWTSMIVSEVFHGQIASIASIFTGKSLHIDDCLPTTHPETDKFFIQMGLTAIGWFAEKSVSVMTSQQMTITVVKTAAIALGSSSHFQKMVLETPRGKAIQKWTHQVSDHSLKLAKIPIKLAIKKSLITIKKVWDNPKVQQKFKEAFPQEIQMMLDLTSGIKTNNIWSWGIHNVIAPAVMNKIGPQTEEMIDKVSEALIKKAWQVAKFAVSRQCLMWTLEKTAKRNSILAATIIVAEGGPKQTVKTFATRLFAAGVFYYTSSKLVGPLMYGFLGVQILSEYRSEYYRENASIRTKQLQDDHKTEDEIQKELDKWWSEEDPLRKMARFCCWGAVEVAKKTPSMVRNALSSLSNRFFRTSQSPMLLETELLPQTSSLRNKKIFIEDPEKENLVEIYENGTISFCKGHILVTRNYSYSLCSLNHKEE